ncbi:MAG TPA: pectinesterase family protein [Caulobacter sp.]|nr:pectinesterase family protein [Caulobacter sp.]
MSIAFDRRTLLLSACGLVFCSPATAATRFDAVVSNKEADPRGRTYSSLASALDAAPASSQRPFRILITAGIWREKLTVTKPNVHLIGEGQKASVIVFDDYAGAHKGGEIATMVVSAPDFRAQRLTIANDFDYPGHMPPDVPYDRTGASGAQATALKLADGSDRAYFEDVALTGWQDTLFADAGRSLFRDCFVSGCVDFIYGRGVAVFDHCEIRSRTRPGKDFHGFIAAPDTDRRQPYGLVFLDCRLTKDADMPPQTMALGRPWRHTMTFPDGRYGNPDAVGHAAFVRCWMDNHIVPEGWYPMHYNLKGGRRTMYEPEDARLFEYASRGPGAGRPSKRRRQLTAGEAKAYTVSNLLRGWRP